LAPASEQSGSLEQVLGAPASSVQLPAAAGSWHSASLVRWRRGTRTVVPELEVVVELPLAETPELPVDAPPVDAPPDAPPVDAPPVDAPPVDALLVGPPLVEPLAMPLPELLGATPEEADEAELEEAPESAETPASLPACNPPHVTKEAASTRVQPRGG
jgi:hypothetical protein